MVEIEGEKTLAASCLREAAAGHGGESASSDRARLAREGVLELLLADQPGRGDSPDRSSHFWQTVEQMGLDPEIAGGALPRRPTDPARKDPSHTAMHVDLEACIDCTLCVRACREVQVNDVIGMARRGARSKIVFDFDDADGREHLRGLRRVRAGLPDRGTDAGESRRPDRARRLRLAERKVDSVCPYCGVGCQLTYHVRDDRIINVEGRNGPSNQQPPVRQGPLRLRLPRPSGAPDATADPPRGRAQGLDPAFDPARPLTHFREASWDEALDLAAAGLRRVARPRTGPRRWPASAAPSAPMRKPGCSRSWCAPASVPTTSITARACATPVSVAALMECIGSGAVTASFMQVEQADVAILIGCNPAINHPVAATFFKQAAKRGTKLIVLDPRGQALEDYAYRMLRFTPGADVPLLNAMLNVIVTERLYDEQTTSPPIPKASRHSGITCCP